MTYNFSVVVQLLVVVLLGQHVQLVVIHAVKIAEHVDLIAAAVVNGVV